MEIKNLSDDFGTCGQVWPENLAEIKALGYRSLICGRPNGEADGQPRFAEIEAIAKALGLQIRYVPVQPSGATEADHAAFSGALADLPGPVLGYCRSGARAATLWQAQQDARA
jgi:sulfide:quinone oxidoreductase